MLDQAGLSGSSSGFECVPDATIWPVDDGKPRRPRRAMGRQHKVVLGPGLRNKGRAPRKAHRVLADFSAE